MIYTTKALLLTGELCAGFRACSKRELSEVRLLSEIRWRILLNGRRLSWLGQNKNQ